MFALITDEGQIAVVATGPHDSPNGHWAPVVDTPRPADTDTGTTMYSLQLIDGAPTVVWIRRAWTDAELEQRRRDSNSVDLEARARIALTGNVAAVDTAVNGQVAAFVNLPDSLTGATFTQAVTAIGQNRQAIDWLIGRDIAHERQLTAIIRLLVGADLLDSLDGT